MQRREFLTFAAGVVVKTEPIEPECPQFSVESSIAILRRSIDAEMPGLKKLQIVYEPMNPRVPLMIVALRI